MLTNTIGVTIRRKVVLAFTSIIVLMLLGTGLTLYQLSQTTKIGTQVIQIHQPAVHGSLKLVSEVNLATTLLNEYLLTGEKNLKTVFLDRKKTIQTIYSTLFTALSKHEKHHENLMASIGDMLNQYYDFADRLLYLYEHDLENYPGLALASELTNPYTLAYLGLLNEQINGEHDYLTAVQQQQVIKMLYDLRYSWIQMNNAFRIFMTTRGDTDLENFYSYSKVNGDIHQRLRALDVEVGFGALEQLEEHRRIRLKNVPIVAKVFKDDAWRKDVYIMKTEVNPLLTKLNTALQDLANYQVEQSDIDGLQLSSTLDKTNTIAGIILLLGILFTFFVTSLILRTFSPITALTRFVQNSSIDNLKPIDNKLLDRTDEVGGLANAFNQMTHDLMKDIHKRQIAEKKFETLLASLSDATIIVNQDGLIKLFNQQAERLFGYSKDEVIGHPLEDLIPERFKNSHLSLRKHFMENATHRPMGEGLELYALHKDGHEFQIEIGLAPIDTSDGLMVSASLRDITDRKETERLLVHQANYDVLTDLPNRVLALDRLSHAITAARRNHLSIAVMFIDLDNFKQVNDSLGHSVGDKLLQIVGDRLRECIRANDTVARLGGDEFLVIIPDLVDLMSVDVIAEKIIETLSQSYNIDERDLFIGASIGITGYPEDGDEPDELLRNADAAMYKAKDAGRNTFRFFTSEMNSQLVKRLEIESRLRTVLENQELYLHFQPLYDLSEGKISSAEALLRWKNPELGEVTPDVFIPIAEETGLITNIGTWVLYESCHAANVWQNLTNLPIRVSVNVSARQFRNGDLVKIVSHALESSGLSAEYLELEITERVLMDDNLNVSRILSDLKRIGISLALDDFGTGYSSLGYLKRFPFDVLKIDRIFVSDITVDPETAALCKAIVAMADSLNLTVVAEGVETEEQFQYLRDLGVHLVQGFYFSRPLSNEDFLNSLIKRNSLIHPI